MRYTPAQATFHWAAMVLVMAAFPDAPNYDLGIEARSKPPLPEHPSGQQNCRLSIVLMRKAPPVPPGHRLWRVKTGVNCALLA